jgi:hypothetical protein
MEKNMEPAFPNNSFPGLTKREWMAAHLLQAYLTNPAYNRDEIQQWLRMKGLTLTQIAVTAADELLGELSKPLPELNNETNQNNSASETHSGLKM